SAGGEVVGGGAGGRGKDETVAEVVGDELAVGEHFQAHEAGVGRVLDEHVVEADARRAVGGGALEQGAFGDSVVAAKDVAEAGAGFVGGKGGEEAEAAAVDAEHGTLFAGGLRDDAEQGAVGADGAAGVVSAQTAVGRRV